MSIDLEAIKARLPRWGNSDNLALIAEVERLRGEAERERAAVVAWLRAEAEAAAQTYTLQAGEWANRIDGLAGDIERGEHRREGGE